MRKTNLRPNPRAPGPGRQEVERAPTLAKAFVRLACGGQDGGQARQVVQGYGAAQTSGGSGAVASPALQFAEAGKPDAAHEMTGTSQVLEAPQG